MKCLVEDDYAEKPDEIHITLFNQDIEGDPKYEKSLLSNTDKKMSTLVRETLGYAVLDTACTRTITGEIWLQVYLDTLSESDKQLVKTFNSNRKFCFGDSTPVKSTKCVKFPVTIGKNIRAFVEADVVDNDLPLLLSTASMKTAGMLLDLAHGCCVILGETVKLKVTSTGHLCLPLTCMRLDSSVPNVILHVKTLSQCSHVEKKKKAMKLHRQFCHASKEKLVSLVKSSHYDDSEFLELIKEVCDNCEICLKFKKPPLRPVVGMTLGKKFNDTVCLDLKEYIHNESWILHLIDTATRYSAAQLIKTKKQDEIIKRIYLMWISYFGAPRRFLTDNGGEFSNDHYRQMNEKLNIETCTTAGESPFSNGTCERHNLMVAEGMKKTIEDEKCAPEIALSWSVSAKNALSNNSGHSPNEMVFGFNINTPTVLNDKIPALDSYTTSDIVRINMNAQHAARKNFIANESSEKIRRALRSKVRSYSDETYESGMKVYYRRQNFRGWRGPATVLGCEGQFVLIRHGGAFYRVHPCQLMKVKRYESSIQVNSKVNNSRNVKKEEGGRNNEEEEEFSNNTEINETGNSSVDQENNEMGNASVAEGNNDEVDWRNSNDKPVRKSHVEFQLNNEMNKGTISFKQPKSSGMYNHWLNVKMENGDEQCINWDHVQQWRYIPERNEELEEEAYVVLLTARQEESEKVVEAKKKELENMKRHNVYELVPFCGQKTISTRWVFTEKVQNNNSKIKARLVARGFEENAPDLRVDSPTCSRESMRLVLLTTSMMNWKLQSIDFTAAFLQGDSLQRDVFLKMPVDVCDESQVWKLKRCIYGLNDAPRSWFLKISGALISLRGVQSAYDNALFMWHDSCNNIIGILAMHVDDFVCSGNEYFEKDIISTLKKKFLVGTHEYGTFKYLGLNVIQSETGITLDQNLYTSTIQPIEINKDRASIKDLELNQAEKRELKRLSGQMMWVTTQTRPDVSYDVCSISNIGKKPRMKKIIEANKVLAKLKANKGSITFPKISKSSELNVIVYSDATYASLDDGSSQGGFIIFVGYEEKLAPICWSSKKLERVTKSPLASETLALSEAADAGVLVSAMLQEIFKFSRLPKVICRTDNASLVDTLHSSNLVTDRRLRIDVARIKEMVKNDEIVVQWVRGHDQLSDSLTKAGASASSLRSILNY